MSGVVTNFMSQRIAVALALYEGKCGGSPQDATLILSSALSAVAAEIWPGDGLDRKRIVEVLIRYARNSPSPSTISIPLLCQSLENGLVAGLTLQADWFHDYDLAQILVGANIDKKESDILSIYPQISLKALRQHSYANLFYKDVRSGIVHQYETTDRAILMPQTRQKVAVSYFNWEGLRRIVFHLPWLTETLRSVAAGVDLIFESLPLPEPTTWWIEG